MRLSVPSQSHSMKECCAVLLGGTSFGSAWHWQPVDSTSKIAFITSQHRAAFTALRRCYHRSDQRPLGIYQTAPHRGLLCQSGAKQNHNQFTQSNFFLDRLLDGAERCYRKIRLARVSDASGNLFDLGLEVRGQINA